jgi:hypothetical protein
MILKGNYYEEYMAKDKGAWWPRWNSKIYSLSKELNNTDTIKMRNLEQAGHIIRMEKERIPEEILNGKFHRTKSVGNQDQDRRTFSRGMHYKT